MNLVEEQAEMRNRQLTKHLQKSLHKPMPASGALVSLFYTHPLIGRWETRTQSERCHKNRTTKTWKCEVENCIEQHNFMSTTCSRHTALAPRRITAGTNVWVLLLEETRRTLDSLSSSELRQLESACPKMRDWQHRPYRGVDAKLGYDFFVTAGGKDWESLRDDGIEKFYKFVSNNANKWDSRVYINRLPVPLIAVPDIKTEEYMWPLFNTHFPIPRACMVCGVPTAELAREYHGYYTADENEAHWNSTGQNMYWKNTGALETVTHGDKRWIYHVCGRDRRKRINCSNELHTVFQLYKETAQKLKNLRHKKLNQRGDQ